MVLYHLLSGKWPYDDLERSERMAATIQGKRPDFNFCGYTLVPSIPSLQILMEDCWRDEPRDRPNEKEVIASLSDAGMLSFQQVIPLESDETFHDASVLGIFPQQVSDTMDPKPFNI